MDPTLNVNPDDPQLDDGGEEGLEEEDPVAQLRAELEKSTAAFRAQEARMRQMEQDLAASRSAGAGQPQFPTTREGWNYALQFANAQAQADPALQPALQQLYAQFNQWNQRDTQQHETILRDVGRVEATLSQMGVERDSPHYNIAVKALRAGVPLDQIEAGYLATLREANVGKAKGAAKEKQVTAAQRAAIEPGEARGAPPRDDGNPKPTPQDQFMKSLKDHFLARAPASTKLFKRGQRS